MDCLRILGWLMAGGNALASLICIAIGFNSDWGPVMMLMAMLSGGLCWIIRSIEALNHSGAINISMMSDKRTWVAVAVFLTAGGGFIFGVCGMARYIQFVVWVAEMTGGDLSFLNSEFGGQFFLTIIGFGAAGINCIIAMVQIKKSAQVA